MRNNIEALEKKLLNLKCKFADIVFSRYQKEKYSLKECKDNIDLEDLYDYIQVFESKIDLLKYAFKNFHEVQDLLYPSKIFMTDLRDFFMKECILTECDLKFLENGRK